MAPLRSPSRKSIRWPWIVFAAATVVVLLNYVVKLPDDIKTLSDSEGVARWLRNALCVLPQKNAADSSLHAIATPFQQFDRRAPVRRAVPITASMNLSLPPELLEDLSVGAALSVSGVWSGGNPYASSNLTVPAGVLPHCVNPASIEWGSWTLTPRMVQVLLQRTRTHTTPSLVD